MWYGGKRERGPNIIFLPVHLPQSASQKNIAIPLVQKTAGKYYLRTVLEKCWLVFSFKSSRPRSSGGGVPKHNSVAPCPTLGGGINDVAYKS